ncbi:uncharacterized protein DS421_11g329870 [Arachis hypogaea]|nr:uncharacterized protein DS421_11g329870 [Arachis hypogaea]
MSLLALCPWLRREKKIAADSNDGAVATVRRNGAVGGAGRRRCEQGSHVYVRDGDGDADTLVDRMRRTQGLQRLRT